MTNKTLLPPTNPQQLNRGLSELAIPWTHTHQDVPLASGGAAGPLGPGQDLSQLTCIPIEDFGVETSYPSIESGMRNRLCRELHENLSAALNLLAERAIQCAVPLTHQIRSGDELAKEQLAQIHDHVRRSYFVSQSLMTEIETLAPWHDSVPHDNIWRSSPQSSQGFRSAWSTMTTWFPELKRSPTSPLAPADSASGLKMSPWCLLASSAQQDSSLSAASAQNIKAAFRELRKSESLIEGLRTKLQAQLPDPLPLQVERTEFLPHLHAQEISRTIMLHHREPGDPAIRNLGGVIAQVPPELVTSVIRGGCQAILCHQQGRLVGLALFLPPGKLTGSFEDLDAHYPNTRNAALVQVLVAPAAQGTGVFETVMNATLLALQSTGAEMVLGEVEHTNDRAKGAYRKFLGVIDDSFSTARTFPSGKGTKWNALIIPMPGHQTESHRHNRMFGQA